MQLSSGHGCMKGLLLEWAHDVHLDPSSELFFWRVFWTCPEPLVLSRHSAPVGCFRGASVAGMATGPTVSKSECSKQAMFFWQCLTLSYLLECYSMELEWSLTGLWPVLAREMGGRVKIWVLQCERWNSETVARLPDAKALVYDTSVDQERKSGDRRRLDTVVVLTVNYTNRRSEWNRFSRSLRNPRETASVWVLGGVWSQGWNLKELTEGHHQEWNLRLNSTQHGKTHQVRTQTGLTGWSPFLILWLVVHGRS